jgi:transcriptional regulator with XRE-family HTH domain
MPKLEIVRSPDDTTGTGRKSESATEIRLGDRVKDLRRLHRWTLDNASERVGLSRSALSKIERGEASPTFDAMQKLAHGFGPTPPRRQDVEALLVLEKARPTRLRTTPSGC